MPDDDGDFFVLSATQESSMTSGCASAQVDWSLAKQSVLMHKISIAVGIVIRASLLRIRFEGGGEAKSTGI